MMRPLPSMPIVALPEIPETEDEARDLVKRLNEAARRKRADQDAELAKRLKRSEELEAQRRKNDERARAGLHAAAIYSRRRGRDAEPARSTATRPRRPRTFGEIARTIYGPPEAGGQVIPTTARGGS